MKSAIYKLSDIGCMNAPLSTMLMKLSPQLRRLHEGFAKDETIGQEGGSKLSGVTYLYPAQPPFQDRRMKEVSLGHKSPIMTQQRTVSTSKVPQSWTTEHPTKAG